MKTATYQYASGHKITFPAHGSGPRLFLEWLANWQATEGKNAKYPFDFKIQIEPDPDDVLNDLMVIRFSSIRQTALEIRDYINQNS